MSVKINKPEIEKLFEEEGMSSEEIREKLYPEITQSNWKTVWEHLGFKGKRRKKKFQFEIVEEEVTQDEDMKITHPFLQDDDEQNSAEYPTI